jgi:hypothetical protein
MGSCRLLEDLIRPAFFFAEIKKDSIFALPNENGVKKDSNNLK